MRRLFLVALLTTVTPLYGAIQYEFTHVTRTNSQHNSNLRLVGKAVIDGDRSRVDYLAESTRGAGQYVISTDGARELVIVDPQTRTYLVRQASDASRNLRTLGVEIANLKVDFDNLGAGPNIAGYPTNRYRLTMSYDITVNVGALPLKQRVQTVIEKWTTNAFGDISPAFFSNSTYDTGDPELDKIIESETTRIPGFPLKQEIGVTSHLLDRGVDASKASRNQVTQIVVTRIGSTTVNDSMFQVPASFTAAGEKSEARNDSGLQILSMTEDPQN